MADKLHRTTLHEGDLKRALADAKRARRNIYRLRDHNHQPGSRPTDGGRAWALYSDESCSNPICRRAGTLTDKLDAFIEAATRELARKGATY